MNACKKPMPKMAGLLAALVVGVSTVACAREDHARVGDLEVSVPWSRATPPQAPVAGGFLTIRNRGGTDDRLLAVESAAAARVEIHEVRHEGEVAKMREVTAGLPLPAGATVVLKPGGYHLMFIDPVEPFTAGRQVPAVLVFERAGRLEVAFEVRPVGAPSPGAGTAHH